MLVLAVEEVLGHLHLLVLLETSLDPVRDALRPLQVQLHVDLAAGPIAEVLQNLVLLHRGCLLVGLLAAISALFKGLEKLGILAFSLLTHLIGEGRFESIKLFHEPLLLALVVLAPRDLDLHLFACLRYLKLLLGILFVEIAQNSIDLLVVSLRLSTISLIERRVNGHIKIVTIGGHMLDRVRLLQIASNHLEAVFLILDRLEERLDLIHLIIEA